MMMPLVCLFRFLPATRQDRAQLRNEFLAFDTENTGTITHIQVGLCLKCPSFEYWFGFIYPEVFWKYQVYTVFPFVWDSWKIETVWIHCLSFFHLFSMLSEVCFVNVFCLKRQPEMFDSTKKQFMVLQICICWVSPRSLIETYVYCTFLYRLYTNYQKRHPPTHPMGCSAFFHVGSPWPDERNSGEVLSHRHPWGWGNRTGICCSYQNRHGEDVFFSEWDIMPWRPVGYDVMFL